MIATLLPLFAFWLFPPPPPPHAAAEAAPRPRLDRPASEIYQFALTGSDGRTVTLDDLDGKVWVASFVVTRCPDHKCPLVTNTVRRLQEEMANRRDLVFVTFVVDPLDDPDTLRRFARDMGSVPDRWLFLAGDEDEIEKVMRSFHVYADGSERGQHSQKLIVVSKTGKVRGYRDGMPAKGFEDSFETNLRELKDIIDRARAEDRSNFPGFNAVLNGIAAVLIAAGWLFIRARLPRPHIICMVAALVVSAVFLTSYLYYHLVVKAGVSTRFRDMAPDAPEWVAYLYAGILLSHTILAVFVAPMALTSAYLGWRNKLRAHVRLARWTMPLWLYVSVTGVVVYWMLYRLYLPA